MLAAALSILTYRELHPDWILLRKAEYQYENKNFIEAVALYEESLKQGLPQNQLSVNLPNSYFALGKFDQAIPYYQKYLLLHPKDTSARLSLAKAFTWVGKTEEAEEQYKKIFEYETAN